jgi:hypothetical protein
VYCENSRAINTLRLILKKEKYLNDLETIYKIETEKPYTQSFLTMSKSWYIAEIAETAQLISKLQNRYKLYYEQLTIN